jgi:long-chain fatty acid transport protein
MTTTRNRTLLALGVALALATGSASATNGYYTHGVGTKSKGQAGAGSANPEELMILATNPAGITALPESIDAGAGIFSPMRQYSTSDSLFQGGCAAPGAAYCAFTIGPNDLDSKNEFFVIPFVGMNWALSDVDHVAAAFYARGGMNTRWEGGTASFDPTAGFGTTGPMTFPGTYGSGDAGVDLMQAFLNGTYARKITDEFSVGVSAIFAIQAFKAHGTATFAPYTKTYVESFFSTGQPQMPGNLSGNGHEMSYGFGGTIGLQWQPTDMFGFSASYMSKMSMSEFDDYADLFADAGGFDMPSTWTIGVAVKPNDRWTLMFDVQQVNYTDVDSVSNPIENLYGDPMDPTVTRCPIFATSPADSVSFENCLGGSNGPGFGWDDMTVYKFGVSYQYSDDWTWRAGYSQGDQPIPSDQMSFNILAPGVMEQHFTVGFTQKRPGGNEVNLSLMYAPTEKVTGPNNFDPSQTVEFKMQQIELEISYSWKR